MSYIGIGYCGEEESFLRKQVNQHIDWLKGDRLPRFYGDGFIVLYDSNIAREFAKKCILAAPYDSVHIYVMEKQP